VIGGPGSTSPVAVPERPAAEPNGSTSRSEPGVAESPTLEDQMCGFTTDFDRKTAGFSPDRVVALVWALTDLLVEPTPGEAIIEYYRQRDREAAEKKAAAEAAERHPAT
jgi:hypothetical protein